MEILTNMLTNFEGLVHVEMVIKLDRNIFRRVLHHLKLKLSDHFTKY